MSHIVTDGLGGPFLLTGGLDSGGVTPTVGNTLVVDGLLGPFMLMGGMGGSSTPPVDLPIDILAALKIAVNATATIGNISGGYSATRLVTRPSYPCVVGTVRPGREENTTSTYYRTIVPVCVRIYSPDPDDAKTLSDALHEEIKGVTLDFVGALVTKLLPDGEPMSSFVAGRSPGNEIHFTERKYLCRVRRARVVVKL